MFYKKITLKAKKEESIKRFHPWIFSGAIAKKEDNISEGDILKIYSNNNEFLAIGHYQVGSIAIRIFSFEDTTIDYDFWKNKIENAYRLREKMNFQSNGTNCYRLIHGEGDFLPGLIVDIYDNTAVIQAHSVGMHFLRNDFAKIITEIVKSVNNVYYKSNSTLSFHDKTKPEEEYLINEGTVTKLGKEYGKTFIVDWESGQKTGYFIDQRENRNLLGKFSNDKKILNMFCYTGGFSVSALEGGANYVVSVDSSEKAIELTKQNISTTSKVKNDNHKEIVSDAFDYLKTTEEKFDIIILDPPAYAKHRDSIHNALQAYKRINAKALEKIESGGMLFSFSCSQAISREQFRLAVFSAAAIAKRKVRILYQLTQPADHPIDIYHPEGEYLKGLVLYVE